MKNAGRPALVVPIKSTSGTWLNGPMYIMEMYRISNSVVTMVLPLLALLYAGMAHRSRGMPRFFVVDRRLALG